jgi:hypothetical protein
MWLTTSILIAYAMALTAVVPRLLAASWHFADQASHELYYIPIRASFQFFLYNKSISYRVRAICGGPVMANDFSEPKDLYASTYNPNANIPSSCLHGRYTLTSSISISSLLLI